jgi:hypothetical protein
MVSVAASSHPSHREKESEQKTTFRSRAGQSRRPRGRTDTTIVVLESQPTAGTVGPDTVLLMARQLLNNTPPPGVSPLAAEHWRHDVNQLVIAAINMPHREGWCQPSPHQSHFSISGVCAVRGAGALGATKCVPTGAAPRGDGQLPDDGPQGGDQPPSRWRGQSHHHRAQPREAPRHQGPQPKKRLRPACTSGCAPSCTCTSPPGSPGVWGGGT